MRNFKVGKKLFAAFTIVIVLSVIAAAVGAFGTVQINSSVVELYENQVIPLRDLSFAAEYFQRLRSEQRNLIINYGNPSAVNSIRTEIDYLYGQFINYMESFRQYIINPYVMELFVTAMREISAYVLLMEQMAVISENPGAVMADVQQIAEGAPAHARPLEEALAEMTRIRVQQSAEVFTSSYKLANLILVIMVVVIIVSVIVSIMTAKALASGIVSPLRAVSSFFERAAEKGVLEYNAAESEVLENFKGNKDELGSLANSVNAFMTELRYEISLLEKIADGDITIRPNVLSDEDVVGLALTKVTENLNNMFSKVKLASDQVETGSKEIANGAFVLAQGTTEQAATVEQLSAAMSEVSQKTKENAEMADKAARLAELIKLNAEKGTNQMDEMVEAVSEINNAGRSISKVIKVIDDIAFQTNILALNAAVEAARAGQNGKGFAVVAEEVRTLAAKSAEAAKDTGILISNSMEKAEQGAQIARETAESLTEIVTGIKESSDIILDIAGASAAQACGISQINTGINQVAAVIQQNSATAEQSAAASQELNNQSEMLQNLLLRFKLSDCSSDQNSQLTIEAHY